MSDKRQELGQRLRAERERLGFDLDALELRTKIRKRYLGALEDGDWDVLPGDVYARGFIRSYAEAVGLNGRHLLDSLDEDPYSLQPHHEKAQRQAGETVSRQSAPGAESADATPMVKSNNSTTKQSRTQKPIKMKKGGRSVRANAGQAALVVGMLAVLGVGWYLVHGWTAGHTDNSVHNTLAAGNSTESTGGNDVSNSTANQPASNTDTATTSPGGNATENTTKASPATPAPVQIVQQPGTSTSSINYSVATSEPLTVQVTTAGGPCWVSVNGDNRIIDGSDTIQADQSKNWQANQAMTIYFGHLNGVSVKVNGQPVAIPSVNNPTHITFTKQVHTP